MRFPSTTYIFLIVIKCVNCVNYVTLSFNYVIPCCAISLPFTNDIHPFLITLIYLHLIS